MILVDTSVLLDFLKERDNPGTVKFAKTLSEGLPHGITSYVYQEVLQGAATDRDFATLKRHLDTQVFYELREGRESYARAARLYFACGKAGLTVAGAMDCLIAEVAIENNLYLLHNDRDYDRIGRVARGLKFFL